MTLFYIIPTRPVWSWSQRVFCQLTKQSCNIFTVSSNPPLSVPPFPCSFIHTAQASHPKQTPHSTSTQALAAFSLHHLLALPPRGLQEADPPLPSASQLQDAPPHSHTPHFHLGFSTSHSPGQERTKPWLNIAKHPSGSCIARVGSEWELRTLLPAGWEAHSDVPHEHSCPSEAPAALP